MRGRGGGNPFSGFGGPFASFGDFGGQRDLMSNIMGGNDPFEDPFFTRPFGTSMFGPSMFASAGSLFPNMPTGFIEPRVPQASRSSGPIIEEINSDDEKEDKEATHENPRKHGRPSKEPYVEYPDDRPGEVNNRHMQYRNPDCRFNYLQTQPQARSFSFQSSTVTYGGVNGSYYTSSRTKRTGSDGVTIDESKEADTTTGEATHKISRGIHDKGHSTIRKLNADGKVDTMQTLINLDEDELPSFEEAWKGNGGKHLHGASRRLTDHENLGSSSRGQNGSVNGTRLALPSAYQSGRSKKFKQDNGR